MHIDAILEQLDESSFEIALVVLEIDLIVDVPVAPYFDFAILNCERMPRQELLDTAEQRCFANRVLERQIFRERRRIRVDFGQEWNQRFRLGCENEKIADDAVIER